MSQKKCKKLVIVSIYVTLFSVICLPVKALNNGNDLILTPAEKDALDKFKPLVWSGLQESFMKSDYYLIRWLRKANLDIKMAHQFLQEMMQWRKENSISNILSEDWSDLQEGYTLSSEGHDKTGRPVLFLHYGDWDLRAAAFSGYSRRLQRYLTYTSEKSMRRIFQAQQEGKNVTRFTVVVDIDGFNIRQHGCAVCVGFLVNWVVESMTYYPDFQDEIILLNVPGIGAFVLTAVRAVASPQIRDQIKTFDGNKKVWMSYLDQRIDRDQRTPTFGGTKQI